ncbi:BBE domain-containing protein, partial [Streptomyces sp. NPDC003393]
DTRAASMPTISHRKRNSPPTPSADRHARSRLTPWTQQEMQVNLLPARSITPQELRAVYGNQRYDRLVSIKQKYDPYHLFRMNHTITAAY